jgi:transposase-like protein
MRSIDSSLAGWPLKRRGNACARPFLVVCTQKGLLKAEGVLPAQTLVRTSKYLNNLIEQDYRKAPQR